MPRERLCQYANCQSTDTPISVNYRGEERPAFCCGEHAALWLIKREWGGRRKEDYSAAERIIFDPIPAH